MPAKRIGWKKKRHGAFHDLTQAEVTEAEAEQEEMGSEPWEDPGSDCGL